MCDESWFLISPANIKMREPIKRSITLLILQCNVNMESNFVTVQIRMLINAKRSILLILKNCVISGSTSVSVKKLMFGTFIVVKANRNIMQIYTSVTCQWSPRIYIRIFHFFQKRNYRSFRNVVKYI